MSSTNWKLPNGLLLLLLLSMQAMSLLAQEAPDRAAVHQVPEELRVQLAASIEVLDRTETAINRLQGKLPASEGLTKRIVVNRIDRLRLQWLESALTLAATVETGREQGHELTQSLADLNVIFSKLPALVSAASQSASKRFQLPASDVAAADQAAANLRFEEAWHDLFGMYESVLRARDIAERLELDSGVEMEALPLGVEDLAQNVSVFLEISMEEVNAARARLNVLPEDAELTASLQVAEDRVRLLSAMLQDMVQLLTQLELDVTEYERQIILSTGQISTQIFNVDVIGGLLTDWGKSVLGTLAEEGPGMLFKLLLFVLIVYVARRLSTVAGIVAQKALATSKVKLSQLLRDMLVSTARNLVLLLGVLVALSQLGISLGPVLTGLGIAGFIVGFALQDSLSNFASGMMMLIYRPFDVGDLINTGGEIGTVSHMSLVNTTVQTLDNQTVVIPNNMIWQGVIKNLTAQKVRRVDLMFGISYTDDIPKTERVLNEIIEHCALVVADPEPIVRLHELGDSSVNFVVRPWVKTDDYWDAHWEITRTVKMRFDEEGISIPFPQRDVHLYQT